MEKNDPISRPGSGLVPKSIQLVLRRMSKLIIPQNLVHIDTIDTVKYTDQLCITSAQIVISFSFTYIGVDALLLSAWLNWLWSIIITYNIRLSYVRVYKHQNGSPITHSDCEKKLARVIGLGWRCQRLSRDRVILIQRSYSLRTRKHNWMLPQRTTSLFDSNFIYRALYSDI